MADVIREYVVGLGYQINEADRRRWAEWLRTAHVRAQAVVRSVTVMATGMAAMAAVGVTAVSRLSSALEVLHHTAQRSGTSAARLRGFAYAVGQMGGTAEDATASVEAFGRALRTNPGMEGLAKALGAPTHDALGRARDAVDVMEDLGRRFRSMPYFLAREYAEQFGIDERTLQALIRGVGGVTAEHAAIARAFGLDLNRTAAASAAFGNSMRRLQLTLRTLAERVVQSLGPSVEAGINAVQQWLIANQAMVTRAVERLGEGIGWLLRKFGEFIAWLANDDQQRAFVQFLEDAEDFLTRIVALIRRAAQFLGLIDRDAEAGPDGQPLPRDERTGVERAETGGRRFLRRMWEHNFGPQPNATPAPEAQRARGVQAMAFFMSAEGGGYTREQAAALVAQIEAESGFNENATHDGGIGHGILGWNNNGERPGRPGRLTQLGEFIGRDPRTATFEEQLRFMTHELRTAERASGEALRQTVTSAQAADLLTRRYVRPREQDRDAARRASRAPYWQAQGVGGTGPLAPDGTRLSPSVEALLDRIRRGEVTPAMPEPVAPAGAAGASSVRIEQNNTITVTGVTEPRRAADAVTQGQQRLNSDLLRNTQGAVR